jgi:hypothetical protein
VQLVFVLRNTPKALANFSPGLGAAQPWVMNFEETIEP